MRKRVLRSFKVERRFRAWLFSSVLAVADFVFLFFFVFVCRRVEETVMFGNICVLWRKQDGLERREGVYIWVYLLLLYTCCIFRVYKTKDLKIQRR